MKGGDEDFFDIYTYYFGKYEYLFITDVNSIKFLLEYLLMNSEIQIQD